MTNETTETNTAIALDAERAVLGAILIHCDPAGPELGDLTAADFLDPRHAEVWRAAQRLRDRHDYADAITVHAELRHLPTAPEEGWEKYLASLANDVPTSAVSASYATIVRREARRREYVRACTLAASDAARMGSDADAVATSTASKLARIADGSSSAVSVTIRDLVRGAVDSIEARRAAGGVAGTPTGYPELDTKTGGLTAGQLVIVAGRPGMGKSTFARCVAANLALRGEGVLIFSFEMAADEIAQAAISSESRVPLSKIRSGRLDACDYNPVVEAVNALHTDALEIVDRPGMRVSEIRTVARASSARRKLGLVVVDYIQLASGEGTNREQEVASITRGLKCLAKELGVPVMALSQLNRGLESRDDKHPRLSDLRESGAIEQDADLVLMLYRDEYYRRDSAKKGIVEVAIAKNRMGACGHVDLRWSGPIVRIDPGEEERQPAERRLFGYEQ